MGKLDGKTAIITGSASGIGAAAARLFIDEGARVMLADIQQEPLQVLAGQLGERAAFTVTDVTDEAAMKRLVEATIARFGGLDIALLNAGIMGPVQPLAEYDAEAFDRVMAVNMRGVFLGLKHAMRAMEKAGGSIVVTSSTAGIRALPNVCAYTTSKHAVIGLMRAAAIEGAARRIRVNSVNPGSTDTPLIRERTQREGNERFRAIPLGRTGTVEEIAKVMLFLASDDSSFCTGGVYMADGGISAGRVN